MTQETTSKIKRLEDIRSLDLLIPKQDIIYIKHEFDPINSILNLSVYNRKDELNLDEFIACDWNYNNRLIIYKVHRDRIKIENGHLVLFQGKCTIWHCSENDSPNLEYLELNSLLIKVGLKNK